MAVRGRRAFSDAEEIMMVARYEAGETRQQLADAHGITRTTAWKIMQRRGAKIRPEEHRGRHRPKEDVFDVPTPDALYWAGFLMADGNVSWRGNSGIIKLSLSSCDEAHVLKFARFVGTSAPPCRQPDKRQSTSMSTLTIFSARMANALAAHGVVPRKSMIAETSPTAATSRDFWRGVVDGDGSITVGSSGWKQVYPKLCLLGARPLMEQFLAFIKSASPACQVTVRPHKAIHSVSLMGRYAYSTIRELYRDASAALQRKAERAVGIIEQFKHKWIK